MKRKYQTGDKIGRWEIIDFAGTDKHGKAKWLCRCTCGTERVVEGSRLSSGRSKSCGCLSKELSSTRNKKDLTGQVFGKLTAIKEVTEHKDKRVKWLCECECGNKIIVRSSCLTDGSTKSCGCIKKTHGMSKTRFYKIWTNMKDRCNNPNNLAYKDYGGRGITYDPSWEEFSVFHQDMYESYQEHCETHGEKNTTMDRIDFNDNYTKENCRWSTYKEQANNTRRNHLITVKGDLITLAQASEKLNISYSTASSRLQRGMNIFGKRE